MLVLLPVLVVMLVSGYANQAPTYKGPLTVSTIPGKENEKGRGEKGERAGAEGPWHSNIN